MEQEKRKKYTWIFIIILVILLLLFFVLRLSNRFTTPEDQYKDFEVLEFTPPSAELNVDDIPTPEESNTEFNVINLAISFTERFGSWSTDNQGYNLEELTQLSSAKMQDYLMSIPLDFTIEEYTGITTKSLSANILSLTEEDALVKVSTQRIETQEDLTQEVYYQDIEISIIKSGNMWLVDNASWQ